MSQKRKKMLAGNWKMNMSLESSKTYFAEMADALGSSSVRPDDCDLVIAAPYTLLSQAVQLKPEGFSIASQNVHWEQSGAYTGEVSAAMLKEIGVTHSIIGHSERRQFFGETDGSVLARTQQALEAGIIPIVCIGELLEERESGKTEDVIKSQLKLICEQIDFDQRLVFAYEPVWAIGTGLAATSDQAEGVHAFIRQLLTKAYGQENADRLRILYGGSMKPSNVADLMCKPNVDGGLVGGASLKAGDFFDMIKVAAELD